jgi:hypothetical protein
MMHFLNDSMDLGRNKRAEKIQNFVHGTQCTASHYAPFIEKCAQLEINTSLDLTYAPT